MIGYMLNTARRLHFCVQLARLSVAFTMVLCSACGTNGIVDGSLDETAQFCFSRQMTDDRHFGCATRHNMAAQAADPDDLYRPRTERPRDAMRRDQVLKNYTGTRSSQNQTAQTPTASNPSAETQK